MTIELKVPSVGESVLEVQIGKWRKAEGETVRQDEKLVEIDTDKTTVELPAPVSGRIAKIVKREGETVQVGEVIGYMEEEPVGAPADANNEPAPRDAAPALQPARVMPAARRVLAQHGLTADQVAPTGPGGRLLKEDVERHAAAASPPAPAPLPAPPTAGGGRETETVRMSPMRRRIAARLVEAQRTAALLTTFNEIDMGAVVALRRQHQEAFQKQYGVKLGFMSFFVKAVIDALRQFPQLNAFIHDQEVVYHNYYDIGIAVSTDKGLVVPVLRNAERLSFAEIELAIADYARRTARNELRLEELEGGTFTITNGGVFGSLFSTPIINPPQSGILGMHAIQDRPVARDGQVVIRPMMYAALTYDHRLVDGKEAVSFLRRVKECIEEPSRMLLEI